MKRLDWLHWVLLACFILAAAGFWVTPYRYFRISDNLFVRINRVTGDTERLHSSGWKPMQ